MTDLVKQIDHIDGIRTNNNVENLRIVSHQQNQWNRTKAKGYSWHKRDKIWCARIKVNNKDIHLGYFNQEKEAAKAYLDAKLMYHAIE